MQAVADRASRRGEEVRLLRMMSGMNQVEAAKALGVSTTYLCNLETGCRPVLDAFMEKAWAVLIPAAKRKVESVYGEVVAVGG